MDKGMGRVARTLLSADRAGAGDPSTSLRAGSPAQPSAQLPQEFEGIVRDGKVELLNGTLPERAHVQVRIKK